MKLFLLPLLLLFTFGAFAQKAKVLIVDPDVETIELEKDFEIQRPAHHYALPDKKVRDEVFEGVESLKKYDELKKDIFFMDLQSKPVQEIRKKYPEIPASDLKIMMGRK